MRNGPRRPHTQQYHLALLRGESITDFIINPTMHIFDFEGKSRHLTNIYNIFRHADLDMIKDEEDTQNLGKEAYMCRRKKMYLYYMKERFGNLITKEKLSDFEDKSDKSSVQFGENGKFTRLNYDGKTFIETVLDHMMDKDREECWYNPVNITKFLRRTPDFSSPEYKELEFFEHIQDYDISSEAEDYFKNQLLINKKVNVDFAEYLQTYSEKIASLKDKPSPKTNNVKKETKDKTKENATDSTDDSDQDEEDTEGQDLNISTKEKQQEIQPIVSWDTLHKEMFQTYKKLNKAAQDKWVSNCINVAISAFVKGGRKPKWRKNRKSKTWINEGNLRASGDCDFTDRKIEELRFYFEDYSNQSYFKKQDTLEAFEQEETKTDDENTRNEFSPDNAMQTIFQLMHSMKQSPDHPVVIAQKKFQASSKKRSLCQKSSSSKKKARKQTSKKSSKRDKEFQEWLKKKEDQKRKMKEDEKKKQAKKREQLKKEYEERLKAIESDKTEPSNEDSEEESQDESENETDHSDDSSESSQEAEFEG